MTTQAKLITYDDYRSLPDDGKRYEIIGGKLFMTPAPTTLHQRILGRLFNLICIHNEAGNYGEVLMAPVDVVLSMTDVVQPDLLFVSKERSHIITKKNIVEAPDLVVEILSESTVTVDRNSKKDLYEKYGVKEYWIVDPEEKQIEQYVLQCDAFALKSQLAASETLKSEVIEGFSVPLGKVFQSD